jgi:hypothetical protein
LTAAPGELAFIRGAKKLEHFWSCCILKGPAQYDLRNVPQNVKGGSTLANRASRFKEYHDDMPGPGTYTIENPEMRTKAVSLTDLRVN